MACLCPCYIYSTGTGDRLRNPWPVKMSVKHLFPGSLMWWAACSSSYGSDTLRAALAARDLARYRHLTCALCRGGRGDLYLISGCWIFLGSLGKGRASARVTTGGKEGRRAVVGERSPRRRFLFSLLTLNIMSIGPLPLCSFACLCASSPWWMIMLTQRIHPSLAHDTARCSTFAAKVNNTASCASSAGALFSSQTF